MKLKNVLLFLAAATVLAAGSAAAQNAQADAKAKDASAQQASAKAKAEQDARRQAADKAKAAKAAKAKSKTGDEIEEEEEDL